MKTCSWLLLNRSPPATVPSLFPSRTPRDEHQVAVAVERDAVSLLVDEAVDQIAEIRSRRSLAIPELGFEKVSCTFAHKILRRFCRVNERNCAEVPPLMA